jgi:2-polyprenyl-3-methyl-5-hydroxy-6-metoxy-1,4-benzoquinol methylase
VTRRQPGPPGPDPGPYPCPGTARAGQDGRRAERSPPAAGHLRLRCPPVPAGPAGYPAELYDELIRLAGLRPAARLLEIGCATGKATVPLAERGFRITCLELGPRLAATARDNLARFPP